MCIRDRNKEDNAPDNAPDDVTDNGPDQTLSLIHICGSMLAGFLLAMICGLLVAALYGVTTVYMHQHQIVMGTAIAILILSLIHILA